MVEGTSGLALDHVIESVELEADGGSEVSVARVRPTRSRRGQCRSVPTPLPPGYDPAGVRQARPHDRKVPSVEQKPVAAAPFV